MHWIDKIENIAFYYCNPLSRSLINGDQEERICNEEIVLDWADDIKRFDYYPGRGDVWIVLTSGGIYAVEVDPRSGRNIQPIYEGLNLDFRLNNVGNLIVKDKGSFIEVDL